MAMTEEARVQAINEMSRHMAELAVPHIREAADAILAMLEGSANAAREGTEVEIVAWLRSLPLDSCSAAWVAEVIAGGGYRAAAPVGAPIAEGGVARSDV